ncbi:MAG: hypothetical protein ACTSQA_03685, partial [Candidatus Heimdallarchaeaceae archaeon]
MVVKPAFFKRKLCFESKFKKRMLANKDGKSLLVKPFSFFICGDKMKDLKERTPIDFNLVSVGVSGS